MRLHDIYVHMSCSSHVSRVTDPASTIEPLQLLNYYHWYTSSLVKPPYNLPVIVFSLFRGLCLNVYLTPRKRYEATRVDWQCGKEIAKNERESPCVWLAQSMSTLSFDPYMNLIINETRCSMLTAYDFLQDRWICPWSRVNQRYPDVITSKGVKVRISSSLFQNPILKFPIWWKVNE